jgi:hypothetical protein
MEPIKWADLIKGILSIILTTLSAIVIPLYAYNDKEPDTIFWLAMGMIGSVVAGYGINLVIGKASGNTK